MTAHEEAEKEQPDINDILYELVARTDEVAPDGAYKQALTAIYEIGLGVIGGIETLPDVPYEQLTDADLDAIARNALRRIQRKAWAKACGVAEK